MPRNEDDDWVGEPPEGFHSADRADPAHWRRAALVASTITAILGIVILVIIVLGVA